MISIANRYDCDQYLKEYLEKRQYPKIHDGLFGLIEKYHQPGMRALDLCCSVGLLGQRLINELHIPCMGIEGYVNSRRDGPSWAITMSVREMRVNAETLPELIASVKRYQVNTLVARRCIYELWDEPDHPFGDLFVRSLLEAGVKYVFLQGLAVSSRSVRAMKSVDEEMQAFARHMHVWEHHDQFAVLGLQPLTELAPNWEAV